MKPEFEVPAKGFYYSSEHKPKDELNHEAWEVLGIGRQKETGSWIVAMRRLFESENPLTTGDFTFVPLVSFNRNTKRGKSSVASYTRITDQDTIDRLKWFRDRLYPAVPR